MPIRRSVYFQDARNMEFTAQQYGLGQKLAEILASVGNDLAAAEPLVEKAGYSQDKGGVWFVKAGTRKITLEANSPGVGIAGEVVTVPIMVMVPTPPVLLPPRRSGVGKQVPADQSFGTSHGNRPNADEVVVIERN